MTREEKAINALKWFKAYNEEDYCGGDRIQDEHGDWYYRITEQDFEAFDMAIKALEQEPTTKNDLGVDCVSRKEVFETIDDCNSDGLKGIFCSYDDGERFKEYIKNLPSVTPQEPKTGHWIYVGEENERETKLGNFRYVCSECGFSDVHGKSIYVPYCWQCGAKMESEDKE